MHLVGYRLQLISSDCCYCVGVHRGTIPSCMVTLTHETKNKYLDNGDLEQVLVFHLCFEEEPKLAPKAVTCLVS